eukprot:GEMP01082201.1.p1 GENE.GEMP01082201.1~~GEMP01082201.1.p1  ORF type:complete len:122 (+),score=6.26 GEMP01082201.1:137-502(+)
MSPLRQHCTCLSSLDWSSCSSLSLPFMPRWTSPLPATRCCTPSSSLPLEKPPVVKETKCKHTERDATHILIYHIIRVIVGRIVGDNYKHKKCVRPSFLCVRSSHKNTFLLETETTFSVFNF